MVVHLYGVLLCQNGFGNRIFPRGEAIGLGEPHSCSGEDVLVFITTRLVDNVQDVLRNLHMVFRLDGVALQPMPCCNRFLSTPTLASSPASSPRLANPAHPDMLRTRENDSSVETVLQ